MTSKQYFLWRISKWDGVEKKLRPARYTLPRIVYGQEKALALDTLQGEFENQLAPGWKVEKNPETGKFEAKREESEKETEVKIEKIPSEYNRFYVGPSGKKYFYTQGPDTPLKIFDFEKNEVVFDGTKKGFKAAEMGGLREIHGTPYFYGENAILAVFEDPFLISNNSRGAPVECGGSLAYVQKAPRGFQLVSPNVSITKAFDEMEIINEENILLAVRNRDFPYSQCDIIDRQGNIIFENVDSNRAISNNLKKIGDHYYFSDFSSRGSVIRCEDGKTHSFPGCIITSFGGSDQNNIYAAGFRDKGDFFYLINKNGAFEITGKEQGSAEIFLAEENIYCIVSDSDSHSLYLLKGFQKEKVFETQGYILEPFAVNNELFFFQKNGGVIQLSNSKGEFISNEFQEYYSHEIHDKKILLFGKNFKGEKVIEEISLGEGGVDVSAELSPNAQNHLSLMNVVEDPKTEDIAPLLSTFSQDTFLQQSKAVAKTFTRAIKQAPEVFLATLRAKTDRNPKVLAEKLFRKMFPEVASQEEGSLWRNFSGYFGFNAPNDRTFLNAEPQDYLSGSNTFELDGGGAETMSNEREILTFREEMNDFVISGIFGKYDEQTKTWRKSFFPRNSEVGEETREITATTASVGEISKISLPLPLDSKIISSRVKGVSKTGIEAPVATSQNSLGEVEIFEKPKSAEKITYSFEMSNVPKKLENIGTEEYERYKKRFENNWGKDLGETLATFSDEENLFISSLESLEPKEKVIAIEEYVRKLGFYDFDNGEISNLKRGKSPDEQIAIMEARIEELKKDPKKAGELSGKKYAGVCADFALVTVSLLRKAGILSGVLSGFMPHNKKIAVKNAHGTAFVVWPDAEGKNMVIPVDGTPSGGSDSRMVEIQSLSLREKEKSTEREEEKLGREAEAKLDEALRLLKDKDESAIRQLQNGELETVVNSLLRYKVKNPHFKMIEHVLENYWYSGIAEEDQDTLDGKVAVQKWLQESLEDYREDFDATKESLRKPAGKMLLDIFEEYADRLVREGEVMSKTEAFNRFEKLIDLVGKRLDPDERKASLAVISYLRAEQMTHKK